MSREGIGKIEMEGRGRIWDISMLPTTGKILDLA